MLNLAENRIGDQGANYLADVLRHNTVKILQSCISSSCLFKRIQTLNKLNLHENRIGDQGIQYIADSLTHNTVE